MGIEINKIIITYEGDYSVGIPEQVVTVTGLQLGDMEPEDIKELRDDLLKFFNKYGVMSVWSIEFPQE